MGSANTDGLKVTGGMVITKMDSEMERQQFTWTKMKKFGTKSGNRE